jgi:hypothetical protein
MRACVMTSDNVKCRVSRRWCPQIPVTQQLLQKGADAPAPKATYT